MFRFIVINKKRLFLLPYLALGLSILLLLGGTILLINLEQKSFEQHIRSHVLDEVSTTRAKLEKSLNERLFLMRGLVAYISTQNPDITQEEFENLTRVIVSQSNRTSSTTSGRFSCSFWRGRICSDLT